MKEFIVIALIYLAAISFITAIVTCADKLLAKKDKRRVPEKILLLLAFFGGAVAEYAVMKLIHHKTLHKKFMVGLPAIVVLQLALIIMAIYLNNH